MKPVVVGAYILLGLAVGVILAWIVGAGSSLTLLSGFLLVVTGAIIGFVVEWFLDEAYRRNRELRREMSRQPAGEPEPQVIKVNQPSQNDHMASETLAEFLREREQEVDELRDQVSQADAQIDALRQKFTAYQRTHPDNLTSIKGIGPVYQRKLRDIGINSYDQLTKADPDRLRRMLDVKSWQRVDIESWITQARDWVERSQ